PKLTAHFRTAWRTRTISSVERKGRCSAFESDICRTLRVEGRPKHLHASLHVQSGTNARERESELDQSDSHGWPHSNDDSLRIQYSGHRGDVPEHPADERVHNFERGDVDEDSAGTGGDDPVRQILLEGRSHAIMHVDLDGNEKEYTHLEDGNALHGY